MARFHLFKRRKRKRKKGRRRLGKEGRKEGRENDKRMHFSAEKEDSQVIEKYTLGDGHSHGAQEFRGSGQAQVHSALYTFGHGPNCPMDVWLTLYLFF